MAKADDWYVYIVERATNKVVKRMGPTSLSTAWRIEDGVNINLNHEDYVIETSDREPVEEGATFDG